MATIFIADDHPLILKGLRTLLEREHEFRVVGSASNGQETVRLVKHYQPDLLLLDLMLPDINGLQVLKQVKQESPQTRVIILSLHSDQSYIAEAVKSGAAGYILKNSATSELIEAIRKVRAGESYFNSAVSQQDLNAYLKAERNTDIEGNKNDATPDSKPNRPGASGPTDNPPADIDGSHGKMGRLEI